MNSIRLIRVKAAQPLKGFTVRLAFSDGTEKTVDLEPYFHGPIFEPVRKDPKMFQSMRVDRRMGTIVGRTALILTLTFFTTD